MSCLDELEHAKISLETSIDHKIFLIKTRASCELIFENLAPRAWDFFTAIQNFGPGLQARLV